jgi:hypothetical protein
LAGLKNAGLYQKVTYNGNLTLDLLPISKTEQAFDAFYQGVSGKKNGHLNDLGGSCLEAIKSLMIMF